MSIDIALTSGLMKGKYVPGEVKMKNGFKKMAARKQQPKTTRVSINHDEGYIPRYIRGTRVLEPLPTTEFVRLTELMHSIPMSYPTMNKMIKNGLFPAPFKKVGQSRLWKTEEVQSWLDKQDNLNLAKN